MLAITEAAFQLMIKAAEADHCTDCDADWNITTRYLNSNGDWRKIAINQINTCETCQARFKDEV